MNVRTWINAHTHFLPHTQHLPSPVGELTRTQTGFVRLSQNLLLLYKGIILWKALPWMCVHALTGIHTSTYMKHCLIMMSADVVSTTQWQIIKRECCGDITQEIPSEQTCMANILAHLPPWSYWPCDCFSFMKFLHCTEHNSWHLFKECEKKQTPEWKKFLSQNMNVHTQERKGHILRVEPIVSPISLLEMFPEGLMLVWLTVLILFLLKDFSTRWALQ